jgi:hypothetical protein
MAAPAAAAGAKAAGGAAGKAAGGKAGAGARPGGPAGRGPGGGAGLRPGNEGSGHHGLARSRGDHSWPQELTRLPSPSRQEEDDEGDSHVAIGVLALAAIVLAPIIGLLVIIAAIGQAIGEEEAAKETELPCMTTPCTVPELARPFAPMYASAGGTYGVNQFLIMAIHERETNFSRSTAAGVHSGVNFAGCCAGPMQFYILGGATPEQGGWGATWEAYADAYREYKGRRPGGRSQDAVTPCDSIRARVERDEAPAYPGYVGKVHPNVYDSCDAIYAAAAYLMDLDAGKELDADARNAAYYYSGQSDSYADGVLKRAKEFEQAALVDVGKTFDWPLPAPYGPNEITSWFGMRFHPIKKVWKLHDGIDIQAPTGTPILAGARGTIVFKGYQAGYGNVVELDHGNERHTFYAHLSAFVSAPVGEFVERGSRVGRVGMTGSATGPHLHFGVRVNGKFVDPAPYLGVER